MLSVLMVFVVFLSCLPLAGIGATEVEEMEKNTTESQGLKTTSLGPQNLGDTFEDHFTDQNLAKAVAKACNKEKEQTITQTDIDNLKNLNIYNKGITDLSGIGLFVNITELNAGMNGITEIPAEIENLTELEELYFMLNQIEELPQELFQLNHLVVLDLALNEISVLPSEVGQLTNLEVLQLNVNQIKELPQEILNLTNLTDLDCNENLLSEIPANFDSLQNLTYVEFGNNAFTAIPEEIFQLTNLTYLGFGENEITELPKEIKNLVHLEGLVLEYNQISVLPDELMQLTNLEVLYLNDNGLIDLPQNQYDFITGINEFDLMFQEREDDLTDLGEVDKEFQFTAYPAMTQFENYGMVFTYNLLKPDGTTVTLTNVLQNGQIVIPANNFTKEGDYQLVVEGTGGEIDTALYTMNFSVTPKAGPDTPDPIKPDPEKPDPVKPEPVKPDPVKPVYNTPVSQITTPATGDNTQLVIFAVVGLLALVTIVFMAFKRKRHQ